jgi:tetratricopeptide (TPR) repeat protein
MNHKLCEAEQLRSQNKHSQALTTIRLALAEAREDIPIDQSAGGHAQLALTAQEMGLWEQAKRSYMSAIDAYQKAGTSEHAEVLVHLYNNIAMTCRELGAMDEAELAYVTAIELHELNLSGEDMESLSTLYANLAYLYHDMGMPSEAYEVQTFAKSLLERGMGIDRLTIVQAIRRAGVFAASAQRDVEAIQCFTKARDLLTRVSTAHPRLLCELWVSEAVCLHSLDHLTEALHYYRRAVDHLSHPSFMDELLQARLLNNVGCIYLQQKHHERAISALTHAHKLLKHHFTADITVRAEVLHNLALCYAGLGDHTASQRYRTASQNLLTHVSEEVKQKLEYAEKAHTAVASDAVVQTQTADKTYVALPVSITVAPSTIAQAMVVPLTTETIDWAF